MKNVNKLFNTFTRLTRMPYQDTPKHCRTPDRSVLIAVLFLGWFGSVCVGSTYTVDAVADGLLAAEARLMNLRLEYVLTRSTWNEPNRPKLVIEAVYAQKRSENAPGRLRYLDCKHTIVSPSKKQVAFRVDMLASFDGQVTTILYRKDESGESLEPMKGYILNGYKSGPFPTALGDPHTKIWYFAGRHLGTFLKEHRDKFHVESDSKVLNGISTIEVVGTLWADPNTGKSRTMKLWVSPERNFLPLKFQLVRANGELAWETALYDLMQLPNGIWYPKTIRSPADPPGMRDPQILEIHSISKISIDPLPDDFFRPKFPPGTRVLDNILNASYTTY